MIHAIRVSWVFVSRGGCWMSITCPVRRGRNSLWNDRVAKERLHRAVMSADANPLLNNCRSQHRTRRLSSMMLWWFAKLRDGRSWNRGLARSDAFPSWATLVQYQPTRWTPFTDNRPSPLSLEVSICLEIVAYWIKNNRAEESWAFAASAELLLLLGTRPRFSISALPRMMHKSRNFILKQCLYHSEVINISSIVLVICSFDKRRYANGAHAHFRVASLGSQSGGVLVPSKLWSSHHTLHHYNWSCRCSAIAASFKDGSPILMSRWCSSEPSDAPLTRVFELISKAS